MQKKLSSQLQKHKTIGNGKPIQEIKTKLCIKNFNYSTVLVNIWCSYVYMCMFNLLNIYRRFNAIVSQLKISLFWVIYIIQKPRYCCVGRLVILHALFGN